MANSWTAFRKVWLKPEVYPLIGSMAAALGVCGAALLNKARDPSVTWNKEKRGSGTGAQLEGVDEIVPLWSSSKASSIRIFGSGNPIMDNKIEHRSVPMSITVPAAAADDDDDDDDDAPLPVVDAIAEEPAMPQPSPLAQHPPTDIVDEAAETIQAAVDAAIEGAAAISDTATNAAEDVAAVGTDAAASVDPTPDKPTHA